MALWPITPHSRCLIDVTTPRRQHPRPGIRFHRSSLPPDEVTTSAEIPVTTVPRTLVDLAADMRPRQLEPALGEAEARAAGTTTTRSELEVRFLEFIDQAGLPQPETNAIIAGFEVDCVWRDRRIIVELDGCAFHSTFEAFDRDRERDRILQTAGWQPVRITPKHLELTPEQMESDLRNLLGLPSGTAPTGPNGNRSGAAGSAA
jgi:very-short-patch-repair endonuclease